MIIGRLRQWLSLLVCVLAVILLKSEGASVGITYLQDAVAKGAVCLDGSPPAYHFDKGSGAGVDNWIVHMEGGGWCEDVPTCLSRKNTDLGSSKQMVKQFGFSGLLSGQPKIQSRYCDGSSFTGDAVDRANNLFFKGNSIWEFIIADLLAKGMRNAKNDFYKVDLKGMIDGGPWMFNNLLMIYSRLSKGDDPLQAHDLLIDFLSESMAKQFENFLGTFVYYDPKSIMQGIKGFMRTSVCLDVRIPLKYHKKIHLTLDWRCSVPRSIIRKLSESDRVLGLIIADGKALSGFLQRCQFTFIPRAGNQVAHYHAKHGFTLDSENFWIEDVLAQARGVTESHRWWVDLSN
ncbi:hypothetical protein GOBAR_DD13234 [Gossypium barbadense]|nr:hypothetical protein GOBAR_DD13234 [Gossypium barbadense]